MGFPDLICIGAQKAGTTWLHAMLSQHPGVFRGPMKEVHFFDSLYFPRHKKWAIRNARKSITKRIERHRQKAAKPNQKLIAWLESLNDSERMYTDEWYEQIFSGPGSKGRVTFEITPAYSMLPLEGITKVKALLGDVPIIYIIRDPLDRILSQIRMKASRKFGDKPISEMEWSGLCHDMQERGDYKTYIPRWLSVFPNKNVHFMQFKRISTEPESLMREVEALVGLPPNNYKHLRQKRLSSRRFDVPQSVTDSLSKHVEPQYEFLETHFGREFMKLI
jgi:hypothetical protein